MRRSHSLFVGTPRDDDAVAAAAWAAISARRFAIDRVLVRQHAPSAAHGSVDEVAGFSTDAPSSDGSQEGWGVSMLGWASKLWSGGGGEAKEEPRLFEALLGLGRLHLADGITFYGLGWSHGELDLSLRCDHLGQLPRSLRLLAASRLRTFGLEDEARALLDADQGLGPRGLAGWLPRGVLTFTFASEPSACDRAECVPVRTELLLEATSPATMHAKGLWVPDFARSGAVELTLSPPPPQTALMGAVSEFGVERGGLKRHRRNSVEGSSDAQGHIAPPLSVQPWWCVCRQGLSAFHVGAWAIPLLDGFAELGLLGQVDTAVSMIGAGLTGSGSGSEAWRLALKG